MHDAGNYNSTCPKLSKCIHHSQLDSFSQFMTLAKPCEYHPRFSDRFSALPPWDTILKMAVIVPCPWYKFFNTYRLKPRPLRKTSRPLLLGFRLTFPFSPPDSYPLFLPLARCFTPSMLNLAFSFLNPSCSFMPSSSAFCCLWQDDLTSPQLAYEPFFLQPPTQPLIGSPSWQPPSRISCLLICSLEILNGLLVLTVSLLKKLQQEC